MLELQTSRRLRERIALPLQIQVDCQESSSYRWMQSTRLLDVSQHGAGFVLTRPTEPGRLLRLAMPLPGRLRNYDYAEPEYSVWGVVRHTSLINGGANSSAAPGNGNGNTPHGSAFRVGVAFIGKHPPATFQTDPATRFQAAPPAADEAPTWRATEGRPSGGRKDERRRETRHVIPVEVVIETFDEYGRTDAREYTVTENISHRGTLVRTDLPVEVGRYVRISSDFDHVSMFAAVRCRITGPDAVTRIGLEFLNGRWPLEGA